MLKNDLYDQNKEINIIKKWYKKIGFSKEYDEQFESLLEKRRDNIKTVFGEDLQDNFLTALLKCEELSQKYSKKGIEDKILSDTLKDIKIWTDIWSRIDKRLAFGETGWIENHFDFRLFRLGRLQFCMGKTSEDYPEYDIKAGDNVLEIHIPRGEPLSPAECIKSIDAAKTFFGRYFPDFKFRNMTCFSWLLDDTLKNILDENSNILKFSSLFDVVKKKKSDAVIGFVFGWKLKKEDLKNINPENDFSSAVKNLLLEGTDFYEAYGILKQP